MRILTPLIALLTLITPAFAADAPKQEEKNQRPSTQHIDIKIGVAISLREVMEHATKDYATARASKVTTSLGSSGQVAGQIENGADLDLFISAGQPQIDQLKTKKLIDPASVKNLASNRLVVIGPADSKLKITSLKDLNNADIKRVAIGEPKTVPAGQYAMEALKAQGALAGLQKELAPPHPDTKLIYGAHARQVLDYTQRAEVSVAIVYATDAKQAGDKVKILYTIPESDHSKILYSAAIISASKKKESAQEFLNYLTSAKGQAILKQHGFTIP